MASATIRMGEHLGAPRKLHLRESVFVSTARRNTAKNPAMTVTSTTHATAVERKAFTQGTKCAKAQTPQQIKQKAPLPTPIRADRLNKLLTGYHKAIYLDQDLARVFV